MGAWMLYVVITGAVLGGAALFAERGSRHLGLPVRWVWLGAMTATLVVPIAVTAAVLPAAALAAVAGGGAADRLLLLSWGTGALVLVANLRLSMWTVRRNERSWTPGRVEGEPVLLSTDFGPGVIGAGRPRIVVPGWVPGSGEWLRRPIMAHEREHVRAGDARLLLYAYVVAALAPWCLPLWWQLDRLRRAVEADCDARVLRRTGRPREYAHALVEMAGRGAREYLPVPAFAPGRAELEQRIRWITASARDRSGAAGLLSLAGAAALVLLLAAVPFPRLPASPMVIPGSDDVQTGREARPANDPPPTVLLFSVAREPSPRREGDGAIRAR